MVIDPIFLAQFSPIDDFWVVVRNDFDPTDPQGLIYNHHIDRAVVIEDDHLASALVSYLLQSGAKRLSVEEYRLWQLSNE